MKIFFILLAIGVIGAIASPVSKQTISDSKNSPQSDGIESQTKHEESAANNGEQKNEDTITGTAPDNSSEDKYGQVDIIIEESVASAADTSDLLKDQSTIDVSPNLIINVPSPVDLPPLPVDQIPDDCLPKLTEDGANPLELTLSLAEDGSSPIDFPPNLIENSPSSIDLSSSFSDTDPDAIDFPPAPLPGFEQIPVQTPFADTDNVIPFRDADLFYQEGPVTKIDGEIMETAAGFVPTPLVFRRKNKPRRRFANRRHFRPNPFRRRFHFFYPYYGYGFYRPSSLRFY